MSWRLLGVTSAVVLATGLLSALPVAAGAKRAAPHAPVLSCGRLRRTWPRPQASRVRRTGRSTRRAPFLSWAQHKSIGNASIVNTYKVTTTADTTPASCPATTADPCTLRQAIIQANTDGTLDKIQVPAAASPYLLETDQLSVTDSAGLVIAGAGQAKTVIEADTTSTAYPFRVLQINSGSNVQISNVTIKDGHSSTSSIPAEDGYGGGVEVLSGALTMRNSTVTANTVDNDGGGIYVAGLNSINGDSGTESQAYLKNVTISGNGAGNGGGGLDVEGQAIMQGTVTGNTITGVSFPDLGAGIRLGGDGDFYPSLSGNDLAVAANTGATAGGGISNSGSLALTGGTIGGSKADGNTALVGGGVDNEQVATLDDVTVRHNDASSVAGGIENTDRISITGGSVSDNRASDAAGLENNAAQATLQGVKVSGNKAAGFVGGLANINSGASLAVSGGSIVGNSALDGEGGGVYNDDPASINGTSITGNTASSNGGGIYS